MVALMAWWVVRLPEPKVFRQIDNEEVASLHSPTTKQELNAIPLDSLQWCGGSAFLATRKNANERSSFAILTEPSALSSYKGAPSEFRRFSLWTDDFLIGKASAEQGLVLARARRAALKALIETNPAKALTMSVPMSVRRHLPDEVKELLEERINEAGNFYLGAICFGPNTLKDVNFRQVELSDGRRLKAYTYGRRLDVSSKRGMSLHGVVVDDAMALHESPLRLLDDVEKEEQGLPDGEITVQVSGEVLGFETPEKVVEFFEQCDAAERDSRNVCRYPRVLGSDLTTIQYKVVTTPKTWERAQKHALSEGGRLVVIDDIVENDVVANLLIDAYADTRAPDGGGAIYAWIGASDSEDANGTDENATVLDINATEGSWKWTDGTDVNASYQNWGTGAPESNGSDYAAMALENWEENSTRKGSLGQWNDINGSNQLAYVIEFDLGDAPVTIGSSVGAKKVLVIRARYQEDQTDGVVFGPDGTILDEGVDVLEPQTLESILSVMDQVSQYYQDNSNGQLILETVATETVNLPRTADEYDNLSGAFGTLLKEARAAAAAANSAWDWDALTTDENGTFDPNSEYISYIVVTRKAHGDYGGLAWVGSPGCHVPGWSWSVAAHELGHNFGLNHANYWDAKTESPIGDGFNQEYGNPLSIMGGSGPLTLAAKRRLDFYKEGRDIAYLTDDTNGTLAVDGAHKFRIYRHDYEKVPYSLKTGFYNANLPSSVNDTTTYTLAPTVEFNGAGGTEANATVNLTSNKVTGFSVTSAGTGFVQEPLVTIVPHKDDTNASRLTLDASWIVDSNGTQLTLLDNEENATRGLRGIKLAAGDGNFYWVSYRHDFDENGLTVVWGNASGSNHWLVDMTRETPNVYEDGGAPIGRTVTDIGSEINFTPVARGGVYPSEYIDVVVRIGTRESNNAPVPSLIVSDYAPAAQNPVDFAVDATDADGDTEFAYSWYVDDALITDLSEPNKPFFTRIFSKPGIRKVRVAVSDMKGGVGSATILIRVSEPEKHSHSRIEGRVLSGGKPVEGARVFVEKSVPIIHSVKVHGSQSDSRIPKYYVDDVESPDLIFYRGQTHRFLFEGAAKDHPLRFGLAEEGKAALAKVILATAVQLDYNGSGYVTAPEANFLGDYQPYAVKLATLLNPSTVSNITVTHGGSGYDPLTPPDANVSGVDENNSAISATTSTVVSGVGEITIASAGSGYPAAPSVIVVGNGTDFNGTAGLIGTSVNEVNATTTGSGYDAASTFVKLVYPTSPSGYWPLDDGISVGATILSRDFGGSDLNGTLMDGDGTSFSAGAIDNALDFNGSRYLDLSAGVLGFNSLLEGSVAFWFKASANAVDRTIFSASDVADADSFFKIVLRDNGFLQVTVSEAGATVLDFSTTATFHDDTWHHVVFAVDATGSQFFVDGAEPTLNFSTGTAATQAFVANVSGIDDVSFGRLVNSSNTSGTDFFQGSLDDIYLYSRKLDATEVGFLNDLGTGVATMAKATANVNAVGSVDASSVSLQFAADPTVTIAPPTSGVTALATSELNATSVAKVYVDDVNGTSPVFEITGSGWSKFVLGYENLPQVIIGPSPTGDDANGSAYFTPTDVQIIDRGHGYLKDLTTSDVRITGLGNQAPEYEVLMGPAENNPGYFVIKGVRLLRSGEGNYTAIPRIVLSGGGEIVDLNGTMSSGIANTIHPPSGTASLLADLNGSSYFTVDINASITVSPTIENFLFSETPTLTVVDEPDGGIAATSVTMQQNFVAAVTVTDGGKGYTNPVQVNFHGGYGTDGNATTVTAAQAHVVADANGSITAVVLDSGGSGYTGSPEISITGGGGTGASARAVAIGGSVVFVIVVDGGTGYRNVDQNNTISVAFDGAPTGWEANATASLGGKIESIDILNGGESYVAPTVTITGDGINAKAHAKVENGKIVKVVIDDPGSGYTDANVTISDGRGINLTGSTVTVTGGDANCTAVVTDGLIEKILINNGGFAYYAPEIVVEGDGAGVDAYPVVEAGVITRVVIDDPGSGFTASPTVRIMDFARDAYSLFAFLAPDQDPPVDANLVANLTDKEGDAIVWINVSDGGSGYDFASPPNLTATFGDNDRNASFEVQLSGDRRLWDINVTTTTDPIAFQSAANIYFYHDPNGASPFKDETALASIHGHGVHENYLDIVVTDDLPNEFYYYRQDWNGIGMGGRIRVVDSSPELHWWSPQDWKSNRHYHEGALVVFDKVSYVCLSTHVSQVFKSDNNVTFERIDTQFASWADAKNHAATQGGHLATFLTQAEWDLMLAETGDINATYFLGGMQPALSEQADGNWKWITGEDWAPEMVSTWNAGIDPPQPEPFDDPANTNTHPERWLVVDNTKKWRAVHDMASAGYVVDVDVINGGTGYTPDDNIVFSEGGGNGAVADLRRLFPLVDGGGVIQDVDMEEWGVNYTDEPTVTVNGAGTGAQLVAVMSGAEFGYILEYEDKSDLANGYWMRLGQAPWVLPEWSAGSKYVIGDAVKIGNLGEEETYVCLVRHEEASADFNIDLANGYWLKTEYDRAITYVQDSDPTQEGFWSVIPKGLETYTDAEGYYAFSDLEHGLYSVGVDLEDKDRKPISYDKQNTSAVLLGGFDELTLVGDVEGDKNSSLIWPDELVDSFYAGKSFKDWASGREYLAYQGHVKYGGRKYVSVKDHNASTSFINDSNATNAFWKRIDKHLHGVGFGFATKPALTILADPANTGSGEAIVEVSVASDGTLDLTINDDATSSKKHDPGDKFTIRTNSWTQGIDFWESAYSSNPGATPAHVVISPNSAVNGIEIPIYWATPLDNNTTFTATTWDADGKLVTDGTVSWSLQFDFNATSGDYNSSIKIVSSTNVSAILALASTLRKGQVVAIEVENGGSNYTSAPTVTIHGDGTGATATAEINATGSVTAISLVTGGSGYSSAPAVNLSGGGGTGATGKALVGGQAMLRAVADANSSAYDEVTVIVGNLRIMSEEEIWRDQYFDTILDDVNATYDLSDNGDADDDNMTNAQEFALLTNPLSTDSDGDGITDFHEYNATSSYGTNPILADTDGDGLIDGDEVNVYFSNPLLVDTDGDGVSDGDEVAAGDDPTKVEVATTVSANGVIYYRGAQSGKIYVTAEEVAIGASVPSLYTVIDAPGYYTLSELTLNASYTPFAFLDADGDGIRDEEEAFGQYAGTDSNYTADLYGIDITLFAIPRILFQEVIAIDVNASGSGYVSTPSITISGGEGSGAAATATVDATATNLSSITVTSGGSSYVYAPSVIISSGAGSGASAVAVTGFVTTATYDETFSFPIRAREYPTAFTVQGSLPSGLTLNSTNGLISGAPDANAGGTYDLNVTASNPAGTGIAALHITVPDVLPPIIDLNGSAAMTVEINQPYVETATAWDNKDGNLSSSMVIVGSVDVSTVGTYVLTYDVTDSTGYAATQQTRTVTVVYVDDPIITLNGDNPYQAEAGVAFVDPGATASDVTDGNLSSSIVIGGATVDVSVLGDYVITYDVNDSAGRPATQVTRTVTVSDTQAPVITLVGDAEMKVVQGQTFTEPGYSATDLFEGAVTVSVSGQTVDVNTTGKYVIIYDASDSLDNNATSARIVTVERDGITMGAKAIDGYLVGATVIFDADGDGNHDLVDTNQTDSTGKFELHFTPEEVTAYDKDSDGTIGVDEGIFILSGGVDSSTGTAFKGALTALPGTEVITPLTTLIASLAQQGQDAATAESLVKTAFGISDDINLSTFDPLSAAADGNLSSTAVLAAGAQVMNVMLQTATVVDYASSSNLSSASIALSAADQLASAVTTATGAINFETNLTTLSAIVSGALSASDASASLSSSDLSASIALISSLNGLVANSLATNASSPETLAVDTARIRIVGEDVVSNAIDALEIEGGTLSAISSSIDSNYLTSYLTNVQATNVFAPSSPDQTFAKSRTNLTLGATLRTLSATDLDGAGSTNFSISSGNFDYDGDGTSAFVVDSFTGEVSVADPDDISKHPFSSVELTVGVTDAGGLSSDTLVKAYLDAPNLLHAEASEGSSTSWRNLGWFGNFHSQSSSWIYHADQGWFYISDDADLNSIWLWDASLQTWIWTNQTVFPYVYRYDSSSWIYFATTGDPKQYYDYSTQSWKTK